jgi:hypothetical protein
MTDRLTLSQPSAKDIAAEDKIIRAYQAADEAKSQKSLDELNDLKKRLDALKQEVKQAQTKPPPPAGKTRHVAHATKDWKAVCTAPDICKLGKDLVAFDSYATLEKKKTAAPNVKACGTQVYCKGDLIQGVQADAGQHVSSGTSQGSGHVKILDGHDSVKVGPDKKPIARNDSNCLVNCDASGNGGTTGKLVTAQKSVGGAPASKASNPDAPPGQRTSERLDRLKEAKAKLESGQLDFNALDEYVNFKDANKGLDGLIGQIQGTPGTLGDYAAQATRGLLGFGKDIVTSVGELAYEGIKAVPKLGRMAFTSNGQALNEINGQILAENIHLGNITPGTVGQGALDIGSAIVKPVTDPWKKGNYVEAVTRGAAEVATLPIAWTKAQRAAQAAKAKVALDAAEAAKAKAALEAEEGLKAKAAQEADEAAKAGDGVHVSGKSAIETRQAENTRLRESEQYAKDKEKVGVSDEQIAAMEQKKTPLGFKDEAQFGEFKGEMNSALDKAGLADSEIGLKGTATTFYSENPSKPLGHHWDADLKNPGDYDLNITSRSMVERMESTGISPSNKYNVFKTSDIESSFPELRAFQEKWSTTLGREVNFVGYPSTTARDATEFILRGKK